MKDQLKFVVHGRKEGNKFNLDVITNYILKSRELFDHKNLIVTFEMPINNTIKMNSSNLIN
jgi:hypothetical protein